MPLCYVFVGLCLFSQTVFAKSISVESIKSAPTELIVWHANYEQAYLKATLSNIVALASTMENASEPVKYTLKPSLPMEIDEAYAALQKGEIDIFIGGVNNFREKNAKPIYVPLDRGLLGFRLCLINKEAAFKVNYDTPIESIKRDVSFGLGEGWIGTRIFKQNGFNVTTSENFSELFDMLANKQFDCFSRSVNEIDKEIDNPQNKGLAIDQSLLFIYPNSQFIYISAEKPALHKSLSIALGIAIEDTSFYDIFDEHYGDVLIKHGIYERRLVFLENQQMSDLALSAINRFGIASFMLPSQ